MARHQGLPGILETCSEEKVVAHSRGSHTNCRGHLRHMGFAPSGIQVPTDVFTTLAVGYLLQRSDDNCGYGRIVMIRSWFNRM